jgi:hypothetical protein
VLCCADALCLQGCAVVTSSRSIPKQAGVYQNLLGSEVFSPLSHRQALLANLLSDKCNCPRCRDEVSSLRAVPVFVAKSLYMSCNAYKHTVYE